MGLYKYKSCLMNLFVISAGMKGYHLPKWSEKGQMDGWMDRQIQWDKDVC